jgi:hypothetical protein
MILIRHIDFIETGMERYQLTELARWGAPTPIGYELADTEQVIEWVRGVEFTRPDGEKILIGASEQAQEVLGIQFEAWGNMEREIYRLQASNKHLRDTIHDYQDEVDRLSRLSLWERVKQLFMGIRTHLPGRAKATQ